MKLLRLSLLCALLITTGAHAEVFRCIVSGEVVFSEFPCGKDATKMEVKPASGLDRQPGRRLQSAIAAHQLVIGMTREEVTRSWGKPDRVDLQTDFDQWVYYKSNDTWFLRMEKDGLASYGTTPR